MNAQETKIYSMDADLSERHVIAGCSDGAVRLYSLAGTRLEHLADLAGHTAPVTRALYASQGELIVSSDFSGKVVVWKLEGGVFAKRLEKQLIAEPIYDIAVRLEDAGLKIFCGCHGGFLRTLTVDPHFGCTEDAQEVHRYGVSSVSCNAEHLVTSGFDFSVALHTKDSVEHFKIHQSAVNAVAIAPSNHVNKVVFASCDERGRLVISDRRDDTFRHQEIDVGKPCHSLSWSRTGFSLTVGFGADESKSFVLGLSGEYEEVEMRDADNKAS